mmetsp:Transcript_28013/g.70961  ORF Transcript_28013/g.70961 Transcript_28013/m.70961 type:complete len:308 (-) Transcript_28013:2408-3331(-)
MIFNRFYVVQVTHRRQGRPLLRTADELVEPPRSTHPHSLYVPHSVSPPQPRRQRARPAGEFVIQKRVRVQALPQSIPLAARRQNRLQHVGVEVVAAEVTLRLNEQLLCERIDLDRRDADQRAVHQIAMVARTDAPRLVLQIEQSPVLALSLLPSQLLHSERWWRPLVRRRGVLCSILSRELSLLQVHFGGRLFRNRERGMQFRAQLRPARLDPLVSAFGRAGARTSSNSFLAFPLFTFCLKLVFHVHLLRVCNRVRAFHFLDFPVLLIRRQLLRPHAPRDQPAFRRVVGFDHLVVLLAQHPSVRAPQ